MPMESEERAGEVAVTFTKDEALVLFEWLHRREDLGLDSMEALACVDQAEQRVLWDLSAVLETVLVEPFRNDYGKVIDDARARLRDPTD